MKTRMVIGSIGAAMLALGALTAAGDDPNGGNRFRANMIGPEETPLSISTNGHGQVTLRIDPKSETIEYELTYDGLEGVAPTVPGGIVLFSHIHFGQRRTTGGVSAFLCGGGSKGACPTPSGTVTGTIVPADVVGPVGQGIEPMSFDELVRAIRTGYAYANVHTSKYPTGEIRGQLRNGLGGDDHGQGDNDHQH